MAIAERCTAAEVRHPEVGDQARGAGGYERDRHRATMAACVRQSPAPALFAEDLRNRKDSAPADKGRNACGKPTALNSQLRRFPAPSRWRGVEESWNGPVRRSIPFQRSALLTRQRDPHTVHSEPVQRALAGPELQASVSPVPSDADRGTRRHLHRLPPSTIRRLPVRNHAPMSSGFNVGRRSASSSSEVYFFFFAVEAALLFAGAFFFAAVVFAFAFFTMLVLLANLVDAVASAPTRIAGTAL
jgi:hypothetical protein